MLTPTREQLAAHYAEHEGKPFYEPLVEFMSSGPVTAVVVEGQDCVKGFRASPAPPTRPTPLPGTIRGDLGRDWGTKVQQNIVHGSDSARVRRSARSASGSPSSEPGRSQPAPSGPRAPAYPSHSSQPSHNARHSPMASGCASPRHNPGHDQWPARARPRDRPRHRQHPDPRARARGVVLEEPSVVAVEVGTGRLVAAGSRAKEMLGRAPGTIRAVRPLRDGVVSDADETERMLRWFIDQVRTSRLVRPRMVLCVPSEVTGVERRALEDAATRCGARRVYMIEEPMAAAIGAGLPVLRDGREHGRRHRRRHDRRRRHQPRRHRHVELAAHRGRRDRRGPHQPRQERVLPPARRAQRRGHQGRASGRSSRSARS